MNKYLVFLDFDGVFTSTRQHYAFNADYIMWTKFDPVAMDFMNHRIAEKYENVEFVLTTTWKDNFPDTLMTVHVVQSMLANAGFRGKLAKEWKTNIEDEPELANKDRAYQIKKYVDEHNPLDYIIFDDTSYQFDNVLGKKRWVKTDSENGLLWKHMKNAASIMGTWNEK